MGIVGAISICLFLVDFFSLSYAATPVITSLPTTVSVGEGETGDRLIHTIITTDASGHVVDCAVLSTNPVSAPFRVLKDTVTDKYGVYTNGPTFNHGTTPSYTVTVQCTDGSNNVQDVLTVQVINGDLLDITNLPENVTFDASTTVNGATIFTCSHSDALGHTTITYSMTSIPSASSYTISTDGIVTTTQDLNRETNSPVYLYITVTDSTIEVTEVLIVSLTNMNNVPDYTDLPGTASVAENVASGYVITTLTASDLDAGATLTHSMYVQPVSYAGYFTFNTGTLQLSLSAGFTFDYEAQNYFNLTFTISDGLASKTEILDVSITNINEACYFDRASYSVSTVEGTAGSNSLNPNFVVADYDGTTTWTFSFQTGNNSERFNIGSTTGLVSFAVDYDIDNSNMASTVLLTVQCEDTTSQTGTTKLVITIADINDNAPVFGSGNYILSLDQYTSAGSLLGALAPTDADSGVNAQYSCSGSPVTSTAATYYSVGSDCGIYLVTSPSGSLSSGSMATYVVTATDKGSTALTGTTTVNVIYRETATTTTSTTTTTTEANWFSEPGNAALFSVAIILGCLLLAALLYFLIRCCVTGMCCGPDPFDFCNCCRDCCRPRPRHQVRTVSPKPREPSKGGPDDNYWGRDREDSDYGSLKNQDNRRGNTDVRYPVGKRDYLDYPQSSNTRLTPTDVAPRIISGGRPLPIGYY